MLQSGIQLEFVQGAQEVFQELPHEFVSPKDLKEVTEKGGRLMYVMEYVTTLCPQDGRTIYATVVNMEDHLEHVDGHQFEVKDFINHPEKYRSKFSEKVSLVPIHCLLIDW